MSSIRALDHEHPCPSVRCIVLLREAGLPVPEGTQCCICWKKAWARFLNAVDELLDDGEPEQR